MAESTSGRQSACNACILKQPWCVCLCACACVCGCVCVSVSVGVLIYVHLATFAHSNEALDYIFSSSSQKWHSKHQLLLHICCDFSHLSILQTAQCSVGTFKRGWLYNNQTLIKLAMFLRERHALQWALLVRYKRTKHGEGQEIRGKSQQHGCWLWISPNGVMCADEKARKIWGITRPSAAFLRSSLHDGHDVFPNKAACLYYDWTISPSSCSGCKQSIFSNIWTHITHSKLKGHSIIWLGLMLWWISEFLSVLWISLC